MKRILAPTGSIYVHCDWHASHYIKVEMDKIFGHQNFRNEVVWAYRTGGVSKRHWPRKHDVLLFYAATNRYKHKPLQERIYYDQPFFNEQVDEQGRYYADVYIRDTWEDIKPIINVSKERIGYPTQKPEALLERVIQTSSNEGDTVFDGFIGGGTTSAVAQRLGRRWIVCDQSRVAVAVTAERLKQGMSQASIDSSSDQDVEVPDFTVEHWGVYEANRLANMPPDEFREFILHSYGATRISDGDDGPHIHGWHNNQPVWVGTTWAGIASISSRCRQLRKRHLANCTVPRRIPARRNHACLGVPSRCSHCCRQPETARRDPRPIRAPPTNPNRQHRIPRTRGG